MCIFCGNDVSQQQYDKNINSLKADIKKNQLINSRLSNELNEKKKQIKSLQLKLNLSNQKEEKVEVHSGIKFFDKLIHEFPCSLDEDKLDEFKDKIQKFVEQQITYDVGFLKQCHFSVSSSLLSLTVTYSTDKYNKNDLIVFRELMMQSISNKDLFNEFGWLRNKVTRTDLYLSRNEVGIYISLKKNDDYFILHHEAHEYVETLDLSYYFVSLH
jgi:hypothetical protein